MEFDFGRGSKPEVRPFQAEKICGKFWQLARAGEGCAVHDKRRKNLRVAMLARVHIKKKVRECTLKPRPPTFVDGKTGSSDLGGGFEIEDARALANFPVRLGLEIKLRGRAPATHLFIVCGAGAHGHRRMRNVGNGEQEFALSGIERGNALVGLSNALGNQLHLRDQLIRVLFLFLEAGNFVAGLVALRFELLGGGDELAAFLIQSAKAVQIEGHSPLLRHFSEDFQMITKVVQVMHGDKRIP